MDVHSILPPKKKLKPNNVASNQSKQEVIVKQEQQQPFPFPSVHDQCFSEWWEFFSMEMEGLYKKKDYQGLKRHAPPSTLICDVWKRYKREEEHSVIFHTLKLLRFMMFSVDCDMTFISDILAKVSLAIESDDLALESLLLLKLYSRDSFSEFFRVVKIQLDKIMKKAQKKKKRPSGKLYDLHWYNKRSLLIYYFISRYLFNDSFVQRLLRDEFEHLLIWGLNESAPNSRSERDSDLQSLTLKLLGNLAISSITLATDIIPMLDKYLTHSSLDIQLVCLKYLWDILFIHPSLKDYQTSMRETSLIDYLTKYLESGWEHKSGIELKKASVYGICRALLYSNRDSSMEVLIPDEYESWLCMLLDICFVNSESTPKYLKQQQTLMVKMVRHFFLLYSAEKQAHQTELANVIIFLTMDFVQNFGWGPFSTEDDQSLALNMLQVKIRFLLNLIQERVIPVIIDGVLANANSEGIVISRLLVVDLLFGNMKV